MPTDLTHTKRYSYPHTAESSKNLYQLHAYKRHQESDDREKQQSPCFRNQPESFPARKSFPHQDHWSAHPAKGFQDFQKAPVPTEPEPFPYRSTRSSAYDDI